MNMKKIKLTMIALVAMVISVSAWTRQQTAEQDGRTKQLEEQTARQPNNAQLFQRLGQSYFYQARNGNAQALEKAIAAFERAAALAPADAAQARWLGVSYFLKAAFLFRSQAGSKEVVADLDRTVTAFNRALERAPDDPFLLSAHGSALTVLSGFKQSQDLLRKGVEEMNRAVNSDPKSIHARLFRGFTHLNLPPMFRDPKVAAEDLNAILKAMPAEYNQQAEGVMRILLGDVYSETKDVARAKAEYESAAKLSSSAADEARARLLALGQGQPDARAIRQYRANVINCAICHSQPAAVSAK